MILKQDLKWSPDGLRVEIIRAGEHDDRILPPRVQEIALQTGLAECETSAKSNKAVKEKKSTTSQEG
ncbi:hypothetical protein AB4T09_000143 [Salmonella enterica]|nr:hypothetical protein [Salmonella enterica]EIS9102068.1 hypothetical protein [Salmonella enterica]EKM7418607.1 hypothetical protein [Salmonella enterica]